MTAYRVRMAEKRGRAYIEACLKAKREGGAAPRVVMDQGGGH